MVRSATWRLWVSGVFILVLLFPLRVSAQFIGPGAEDRLTDAQSILNNPVEEEEVSLRGRLAKKVGDEKYLFQDDSGGIRVEIDDDEFLQLPRHVTPDMRIEIYGEVETSYLKSPEVDVEIIRILSEEESDGG